MKAEFLKWLIGAGIPESLAPNVLGALLLAGIIVLSYLAGIIAKKILLYGLQRLTVKSNSSWYAIIIKKNVFRRAAHLAPAFVFYVLVPAAFPDSPVLTDAVRSAALIYMLIIALLAVDALLDALHAVYETLATAKIIPAKGFVQALKIIIYFIGVILLISVVTTKTPLYILSGLGAVTAVLLLIFKDTILGLVAGIQLTANAMVRTGDWISMPQFEADGDVVDVALTTVKVQNWDKTIAMIPTYALISQSFKNWRGMQESGGRRIKRAIYLDMTSVRFCDDAMMERFGKIQLIREYLEQKKAEIGEDNQVRGIDTSSLVNGRRLTNIGTFRAYVDRYLKNHSKIRKDMTFLVRQLDPTDRGIPLEIYVFSSDQEWAKYEAIQADIFDHILAVIPEFDLRVFQNPTGADFRYVLQSNR